MSPTITQADMEQGRARLEEIRPANLLELAYRDETNTLKHRLIVVVGDEPGKRAVYSFPEKLGTALDIWPLNNRLAKSICDELDARDGVVPIAEPVPTRRGIGG